MGKNKIVVVSHKYTTTPEDYLVGYLKNNGYDVIQICHSFSDMSDRISSYSFYRKNITQKAGKSWDFRRLPEPFIYVKEAIFTVWTILITKTKWDIYVGIDGLCVIYGLFLQKIGRVKKTVYWAMDYVPENRFKSKIKNVIYKLINKYAYLHANEVWDLSPRMAEAREMFSNISRDSYKAIKLVPYGVFVNKIKKVKYVDCEKNTLVFMGHILEKQGAQMVIQAIPLIIKEKPDFMFKVIGGGEYLPEVMATAKKLNVEEHCCFLGKLQNHDELQNEIAKSCVAIAPYVKKLDTWTYYADPGKVKEYLGCGVPVLLTDIPWNAHLIEESGCGKIITTEAENIAKNVIALMDGNINQQFRDNAINFARDFDYSVIFNKLNL